MDKPTSPILSSIENAQKKNFHMLNFQLKQDLKKANHIRIRVIIMYSYLRNQNCIIGCFIR